MDIKYIDDKNVQVNGSNYHLTFEDNFEGNELDTTKWELCPEWPRHNLGGKWAHKMTEVKDGHLYLNTGRDDDGTVISGAVQTEATFKQTYGYFEAKMRFPKPPVSFWGAFWLMCGNVGKVDGSAVSGIEIDVIESITNKHFTMQHNLHWDGYGADHKSTGEVYVGEGLGLYDGWHTYGVEWSDEAYSFFIDGKLTWQTSAPGMCNQPGYMLLSIEYGNQTGFSEILEEHIGPSVEVDYVKAYAKD